MIFLLVGSFVLGLNCLWKQLVVLLVLTADRRNISAVSYRFLSMRLHSNCMCVGVWCVVSITLFLKFPGVNYIGSVFVVTIIVKKKLLFESNFNTHTQTHTCACMHTHTHTHTSMVDLTTVQLLSFRFHVTFWSNVIEGICVPNIPLYSTKSEKREVLHVDRERLSVLSQYHGDPSLGEVSLHHIL